MIRNRLIETNNLGIIANGIAVCFRNMQHCQLNDNIVICSTFENQ